MKKVFSAQSREVAKAIFCNSNSAAVSKNGSHGATEITENVGRLKSFGQSSDGDSDLARAARRQDCMCEGIPKSMCLAVRAEISVISVAPCDPFFLNTAESFEISPDTFVSFSALRANLFLTHPDIA